MNFMFMGFAKGAESTNGVKRTLYTGVAPVQVLCVNPNKAEIEKYLGYTPNEEPVYVGGRSEDGRDIYTARVSFVVKTFTDEGGVDVDTTQMLTFFLESRFVQGSQSGKYHVIDEYGRDAWADKETIQNKAKIMYKEGTMAANISQNYRPLYVGELELTMFLKNFLNIPDTQRFINGQWVTNEHLEECTCRLEDPKKLFEGNFSEIKEAISLQPYNRVKVLFGVRETTDDQGNVREYQDLYSQMTLKSGTRNNDRIRKHIEDRKAAGALANRNYTFGILEEYVKPSQVTDNTDSVAPSAADDLPW